MVKGPCRGKKCDFWARVRIRKTSIEELAAGIKECIIEFQAEDPLEQADALYEYWSLIGVQDLKKLCDEEPDLCAKMTEAEILAQI
jgi:hypothetical protein